MSRTALALVLVAAACGGHAAPPKPPASRPEPARVEPPPPPPPPVDVLPAIPSTPQPAPADLLATASIGDVLGTVAALAGYADAVQPGVGATLTPQFLQQAAASQGLDLRGVDLSRPVQAFLLDPQAHPQPLVVVVAVADDKALHAQADAMGQVVLVHGGWAAIGAPDGLRAVAPYALTTAVATPPPAMPRLSIAMTTVMARYRPMVEALIDQASALQAGPMQQAVAPTMRAYLDLFDQLDRLDVDLTADRARAGIAIGLAARPGTALASVAASQRPGEFKLLERLGGGALLMGGRIDTSLMFDKLMELSLPMMSAMYGGQTASGALALFQQWPRLANGENAAAFTTTLGKAGGSMMWDITDGAAAQKLWLGYLEMLGKAGGTMAVAIDAKPTTYRGVRVAVARTTTTDPALQAGLAVYGGQLQFGYAVAGPMFTAAVGGDVVARLKALIDLAIPKKAKPPVVEAGLAAAIAGARARGDSYLIAIDAPALKAGFTPGAAPAAPSKEHAAIALGFGGATMTVRVVLPATQLAALIH